MIRLVAFDLDGTAVYSDNTVGQPLKQAVRRAQDMGVMVAVSTGRIYPGAKHFADLLGITGPMVNAQGAAVTDITTGELLYTCALPLELVREIVPIFRENEHYIQANAIDAYYYEQETSFSAFYGRMNFITGTKVDDLCEDLPRPPLKMIGLAEPEVTERRLKEVQQHFGERLEVSISKAEMLEMTHPDANKGNAVAWLADYYGLARDEVMTIGDSLNDITMIRYAGLGVAVANARPEILASADVVVPSNDEDGAAWAIEKYVLNV